MITAVKSTTDLPPLAMEEDKLPGTNVFILRHKVAVHVPEVQNLALGNLVPHPGLQLLCSQQPVIIRVVACHCHGLQHHGRQRSESVPKKLPDNAKESHRAGERSTACGGYPPSCCAFSVSVHAPAI